MPIATLVGTPDRSGQATFTTIGVVNKHRAALGGTVNVTGVTAPHSSDPNGVVTTSHQRVPVRGTSADVLGNVLSTDTYRSTTVGGLGIQAKYSQRLSSAIDAAHAAGLLHEAQPGESALDVFDPSRASELGITVQRTYDDGTPAPDLIGHFAFKPFDHASVPRPIGDVEIAARELRNVLVCSPLR